MIDQNEGISLADLKMEHALFKCALNEIGAYIYTKDINGCYTFANTLVLDLFGLPLDQVIGKDDSHFFDLAYSKELRLNDRQVLDQGKVIENEEVNFIKSTGKTRIYWSVKKPLRNDDGEIVGMCGVSTDITERKQVEKERESLIIKYEAALLEIKTLQGIIPICSYCHSIRDDKGAWSQLENYIARHSEARFSHGICPQCLPKAYADAGLKK
ncbi:MAG: PAS domain-containing protein [Gammaproteobacteria bacterium]|nr:PAS domain-containing protein [Gammaproteobacteria bacterium]MDH5735409.1 PAS domain-containing protein [Gammaproteobacteria bacterium]